jgi:hypothetical protein
MATYIEASCLWSSLDLQHNYLRMSKPTCFDSVYKLYQAAVAVYLIRYSQMSTDLMSDLRCLLGLMKAML